MMSTPYPLTTQPGARVDLTPGRARPWLDPSQRDLMCLDGPLVAWFAWKGDALILWVQDRRYIAREERELGLTIGGDGTRAGATWAALPSLAPSRWSRKRCPLTVRLSNSSVAPRCMPLNGSSWTESSSCRRELTAGKMSGASMSDRSSRMRS